MYIYTKASGTPAMYICTYVYLCIYLYISECNTWTGVDMKASGNPATAPHCNTLHNTVTLRNTLQHTATWKGVDTKASGTPAIAPHCNTLQHTTPHHNTLQHIATPQHTATHCDLKRRWHESLGYPRNSAWDCHHLRAWCDFGRDDMTHLCRDMTHVYRDVTTMCRNT